MDVVPLNIISDHVLEEFCSMPTLSLIGLDVPIPKGGILQLIEINSFN